MSEGGIMQFDVEFYRKQNGECPIQDFLDHLSHKIRAKVLRDLELLEMRGNELREPQSKQLGCGIFELRSIYGTDISRVLYFFAEGRKIVLTNGFIKKTIKIPGKELKLAKEYRKDYLKRGGGK